MSSTLFLALKSVLFLISSSTAGASDELFVNCSLLALDSANYNRIDDFVYVVWDPVVEDIVTSIVLRSDQAFVLSEQSLLTTNEVNHQMFPGVNLICSANLSSFLSIFSSSKAAQSSWFPKGVFVVILQNHLEPDLAVISDILYSAGAYNFIILTKHENRERVNIYKWDPFAEISRCGTSLNVSKINTCDGLKMLEFGDNLFTIDFAPSFPNGCPVNAAAFHWPPYAYASPENTNNFIDGLSIRTMEIFKRMYNLKVNYIWINHRERWGVFSKANHTWNGVIGAVQKGEADLALGQILQTSLRFKFLESSYTGSLFMKFYLALPGQLPHWKSMIRIFPFSAWIFLLFVYVFTSLIIWIVSRTTNRKESEFYKKWCNCFLNLWRIALSTPSHREPSSEIVRLVFVLWLVCCFHITLIYSSALLGVITTSENEEPTIKTLEQFSNSKLRLMVVPQFVQISSLMDDDFKSIFEIKKKGDLKITDTEEIEQMISKKDFAIVDPHEHFEIVAQEKLEYIYTLDDAIRLNQGLYLRKGSIYSKYVNKVQQLLSQNGIYEKWRRDLIGGYRYKKHHKIEYRHEVLPLTMDELSGSFYVLLFGLLSSFICFCFELLSARLNKKFNKN